MKWFLLILWDPLRALDLRDRDGNPDHSKVAGFFGFLAIYLTIFLDKLPPLGHTVALLSVIFGWVGWRTFLKSRTVTASETRQVSDQTVRILERRDADTGVDPAP